VHQKSRLGAAVCVAALALTVAGCGSSSKGGSSGGSSSGGSSGTSTSSSGGSLSGKGVKVVYIPGLTGNPFYSTVACGAAAEAKKLGAQFSVQGAPTFAVNAQTPVVEAVTAKKPSAIMISNDDPKAMIPPLLQAQKQGIKIVNIDGDLAEKSIGVTNIQSNDTVGGQLAGKAMGKLVGNKHGDILILDNSPGFVISEERRNGLIQVLQKQYPNLHILPVQYTNNETSTAASDVRSTAAAHKNLVGVYTVETNNTEGAVTAIKEAHLTGKVKLIGYDTSPPIVAAIHSGLVSADIVQYPYGEGMLGLKSAVMAVKGQSVPREQTQPFVVATKANINSAKVQKFIYKTSCS
jgi:ribose transport system substrate-binding protein